MDTVSKIKLCECGCGNPAPIATKTSGAQGYIKGMPTHFLKGHHRRKEEPEKTCLCCGEKLERKINKHGRIEDLCAFIKRKLCSYKCTGKYMSGDNHYNWRGGKRVDKNGYIYILVGKHHHLSDPYGYALEHRIVAEEYFGKKLKPKEVVHHKNEDKHDNRGENLEILFIADHFKYHRNHKKIKNLE